jgi:GNAT superfamily N-acetyltransferase
MTLQIAGRYPRRLQLRDSTVVELRPMSRADETALVDFFRSVPAEERFFLKEDVTSADVIRGWIETVDYEYILPLLAIADRDVVADAALLRHRSASLRHAAEIRIVVSPDFRGRGLAVGMLRELLDVARQSGLVEVVFECVAGVQDDAIEAAEFLGATVAGTAKQWVRDADGQAHDVVFLKLPLTESPAGA